MSDVIEKIAARFVSGNSIPVERAHITADEFEALKSESDGMVERLRQVVEDVTDVYESMDASYDRHCMYEFENRMEEIHAENLRIASGGADVNEIAAHAILGATGL